MTVQSRTPDNCPSRRFELQHRWQSHGSSDTTRRERRTTGNVLQPPTTRTRKRRSEGTSRSSRLRGVQSDCHSIVRRTPQISGLPPPWPLATPGTSNVGQWPWRMRLIEATPSFPVSSLLQVAGCQSGVLGDSSEDARAEFHIVVKGEDEVRSIRVRERAMRARLTLDHPADSLQGRKNPSRFGGGPVAHAARKVTLRNSAGASRFSRRSAMTRRASAWTPATASSRSCP